MWSLRYLLTRSWVCLLGVAGELLLLGSVSVLGFVSLALVVWFGVTVMYAVLRFRLAHSARPHVLGGGGVVICCVTCGSSSSNLLACMLMAL